MLARSIAVLTLVAVTAPALAQSPQQGWVCTTEQMTGFSMSSGSWNSVDFATRSRYQIRRGNPGEAMWVVRPFGRDKIVEASCREDFSKLQVLHCDGQVTQFKFNRKTGRFLRSYLAGYWSFTPNAPFFSKDGADTPYIEIGTCTPG